jgi:SAM-dependent methyltransferase
MSYVATIDYPGRTMADHRQVQDQYADDLVDGLVAQVAGPTDNGLRVVSVWESRAAHDRFLTERLYPAFERSGPPAEIAFADFVGHDLLRGPAAAPPPQLLPGAPDAANRMYALILGYWSSQIAGTLARFAVPDLLATGPRTVADLAAELDCAPGPLFRLLRAAAAVGVLDVSADGVVALTPTGAALRSDVPGSLHGLARTLTASCHWLPWGRLDEAVRTGSSAEVAALGTGFFEHLARHPTELGEFTDAMGALSDMIAAPVVELLELPAAAEVVDVGGGSGTLLAALLDRHPTVHGTLLERPEMVPAARALLADRGLAARCDVVAGDFFTAVPEADVHVLKLITHDWDDEHAAAVLRNCAAALRPGGTVVIVDAVVPDDPAKPLLPLLDLHMHVVLGGHERTAAEHAALLRTAGLRLDRIIETGSHAQIIEASPAP